MRTNDWVGKRKAARQPVNMRAEMRFNDGRKPLSCKIVDISANGCAIELDEEIDIPEDFDLFIESRSELKFCKIRRAAGKALGVAFLKSRLDDPLVMQTLMERVSRLERGYAQLAGGNAMPEPSGERRSTEPRRDDDKQVLANVPLLEDRVKALATGLADLRATVDRLASGSAFNAAPAEIVPKVDEHARDIAGLKDEMANLARALRGATASVEPGAGPVGSIDYANDIAALKTEMIELSATMRNIAATPALSARSNAVAATQPEAGTIPLAKMRAEIAELRASVQASREGAAAGGQGFDCASDIAFLKRELADVRANLESSLANVPQDRILEFVDGLGSLRVDAAELKERIRAVATLAESSDRDIKQIRVRSLAPGDPQPATIAIAAADPRLAAQLEELRGAVKTLILLVSKTVSRLPAEDGRDQAA